VWVGLLLTWLAVTLLGVTAIWARAWVGDLGCEANQGDSNYGELQWSMLPPGPKCVFTEEANGYAATEGPSPAWSVWFLGDVALLVFTLKLGPTVTWRSRNSSSLGVGQEAGRVAAPAGGDAVVIGDDG
jgi:hypothetical protein